MYNAVLRLSMVSVMREKKALFWWKSERLQRLVVIMKSVLHNAAAALLLLVAPSAFSALAVGDLAPPVRDRRRS